MIKRMLFIFILTLSLSLNVISVDATSMPLQPVCEITAVVLAGNMGKLELEITESGSLVVDGHEPGWDCSAYATGTVLENVVVVPDRDTNLRQYKAGAILKGDLQFVGDEFGTGHLLFNSIIIRK